MKDYKQLLEGLPPKTIVFAFGRFNPPTIGHELLIKVVKKVASAHKADYVIYASRTQDKKKNPLNVDRKIHYLNIMFPGTHFLAANDQVRTPIEVAKALNKKYKNIIMIAGGERVADFTKLLNQYNGKEYKFDSIQVISAGERDPDSDEVSGMSATKMRAAATKGDYVAFKSGLPSSVRDIDGKLLMNDIRQAMGQEVIKEQINLVKDDLREQYFKGEIFNVGDIVESNNELYEIVKRGSNHLLLKEQSGNLVSKWIQDVTATQGKEMNEDLTDKTIKPNDKLKVARIIAAFLGLESPESLSNPEQIVNMGLRKAHAKSLHADSIAMLNKMMSLADEVGIKYDSKLLPKHVKESIDSRVTVDPKSGYNAAKDILRYSDFKKLMKMNKGEVAEQAEVLPTKLAKSKPDVNPEDDINQNDYDDKVASEIPDDRFVTYNAPKAVEMAWKELENKGPTQSEVGHAYGHGDNSHLRRQKVHYQREEVEIEEAVRDVSWMHQKYGGAKYGKPTAVGIEKIKASLEKEKKQAAAKKVMDTLKDIHKELEEDIASADYKVNPDTGRKSRARVVTFANSKMGGKPDNTPNDNEDENEYKRTNKKVAEAYNHASIGLPNPDRTDKKGDAYNPTKKTPAAIEKINKAKEADAKHTGLYKKQSPAQRKATVDSYMKMLKDIGEETEEKIKFNKTANIKADKMSMGVNKGFDAFFNEEEHDDIDETELDKLANTVNDIDDVIDAYDDEELAIVDDESGEEIEKNLKEENETLNEVLSRMERIRAKARFARTSSKRQRATKIALKRHSNTTTINRRARKLAVNLMKQRIARKPLNKLSIGEKERIELIIQRRKAIINRLAMKLAPRVRKIENDRLSHSKYTKR